MSSLQEKICQTFCLQAWQGPKWYNAFKCLLRFEAKSVLGLICLHLNTIGWSSHMTSMIRRDNWLWFRSVWLVFRIRVYGQVLGLGVQCSMNPMNLKLTQLSKYPSDIWKLLVFYWNLCYHGLNLCFVFHITGPQWSIFYVQERSAYIIYAVSQAFSW